MDLKSAKTTSATVTDYLSGTAQTALQPANAAAYPVTLPAQGALWLKLE